MCKSVFGQTAFNNNINVQTNMRRLLKLLIVWILLFIPLILVAMGIIFKISQNQSNDKYNESRKHIGEKIEINNLIDLDDNTVKLQCNSDITLIDFWYRGCKPCIESMEQFGSLISGLDNKISVISISIEDKNAWKSLFNEGSPLPFLTEQISNWKHYAVPDTTIMESEGRMVTRNGASYIMEQLGAKSLPLYLVLNKEGILIDVPTDGEFYLKKIVTNQPEFVIYWTKMIHSKQIQNLFLFGFAGYSLIYWLIVAVTILILHFVRKSKVANRETRPE